LVSCIQHNARDGQNWLGFTRYEHGLAVFARRDKAVHENSQTPLENGVLEDTHTGLLGAVLAVTLDDGYVPNS